MGPTATGKSTLAINIVEAFRGEIVNADSRLVYRGMDIGTAKPSPADRARVPHHVIDLIEPDGGYNVAYFQRDAAEAISDINRRGRAPLLVGGSGHYMWALPDGLRIPPVRPNEDLRRELTLVSEEEGGMERLLAALRALDPVTAARIDPRNIRRVVRAIEVSRAAGKPFSEVGTHGSPPYSMFIIGLTLPRDLLYTRIDQRVDAMVEAGWVNEVGDLLARGFDATLAAFSSLGYREIIAHIQGQLSLDGAVAKIKSETHRFARHQYGWFRPADKRIQWIDISMKGWEPEAERLVGEFVQGRT